MQPNRDPGERANGPPPERPLQPDGWSLSDVPPSWLLDADTSSREAAEAADELDRLQGDTEMLGQLRSAGFQGKVWSYFTGVLARYGYSVIRAWLFRREILGKCRAKGLRGVPHQLAQLDDDDVAELAGETIAEAIHHFREEVLIPDKWDPRRKASLRTYFVGQCLIRFLAVYDRWFRENRHRKHEAPLALPRDGRTSGDPATEVLDEMIVDEQLGDNERAAQVLRLVILEELPHEEVARRMTNETEEPMTAKAVEAIVYRFRQRHKRKGA